MAHKLTAKRSAALNALSAQGKHLDFLSEKDSESLYDLLEGAGYWWNASAGAWAKGKPPSTSMFTTDDGEATGIVRLRVMGHPADLERAIAGAKKAFRVAEVSDRLYPNRKGPGYRAYLTILLKADDDE